MRRIALAAWLAVTASAQAPLLQVRVVEGEGVVRRPGALERRPLTVEVTDETGQPVAGVAVSFVIAESGPGGLFTNGLRTELVMSDAAGRAAVPGVRWSRAPGPFEIRIFAVKDGSRAGTVSRQYIGGTESGADSAAQPAPAPRTPAPPTPAVRRGRRWWIAGAIGGAAVAGLVAGTAGRSTVAAPAPPSPPPAPAVSIGAPTLVISRP